MELHLRNINFDRNCSVGKMVTDSEWSLAWRHIVSSTSTSTSTLVSSTSTKYYNTGSRCDVRATHQIVIGVLPRYSATRAHRPPPFPLVSVLDICYEADRLCLQQNVSPNAFHAACESRQHPVSTTCHCDTRPRIPQPCCSQSQRAG